MMPLKVEPKNSPYEFIQLDTFSKNLKDFNRSDQQKILIRIHDWLSVKPESYPMLSGAIVVSGKKIFGLRHIKIGVKGHRGGAYVLYRICCDCIEYEYWKKSKVKCQFCDPDRENRIVLFDVQPRGFDYGR